MAKVKEKRKRLAITATDEDEMKRFEGLLHALYPHAKPSTAAKMLFLHLCENTDAIRDLVTNGNHREPMETDGTQREPMDTCPSPARTHEPPERRSERKNELDTSSKLALPVGMSQRVTEYLNSKAGTSYRPSGKKLKELIRARVNEGATEQDFITVIDKKCQEWLGTDMEKYLRPLTLFGPKFDEYLGQKNGVAISRPRNHIQRMNEAQKQGDWTEWNLE